MTRRNNRWSTWTLLLLITALTPLLGAQAIDLGALTGDSDTQEEAWPPNNHIKMPQWKFVDVFAGVADTRTVDAAPDGKAVKTIKEKFAQADGGKNLAAVGDLFKAYSFEAVEKIAKDKHLSPAEADGLSRMRREMINQAMADAIAEVDPGKKLTIGMLDSGNKNSGIASDVDQTVFVIPKDAAQKLGVDENKVIAAFNRKFKEKFGVSPERLGIESLNGADFFPDWRQAHSTGKVGTAGTRLGKEASGFADEADRVVNEKRLNPEAYRSEGQLKSQAEGRGYESLQEHHQRVRDLNEAKDRIESIEKNPELTEAQRKAQIADIVGKLLKQYNKTYPATSVAELEAKFHKDSPWTEVGWDKDGKPSALQLADPKNKVLANKPEFHQRFAFDGAWDNWIMYEHHPHNRRKYLLRSIAEGISLQRQRDGKPLSTLEYEKVYGQGDADSRAQLRRFIDDVYRDLPENVRDQFQRAMDVAAKERLRHKGVKNPTTGQDYTVKEVWSQFWPAVSEAERAMYSDMPKEAFEKMLHERAIQQWERVGREIMIENLIRTVEVPANMLRSPMTDAEFTKVKEKFPDATRAKLSKAVQRQLYHGIHDLISIDHARELVASAEQRKNLPPRNKDLVDRMLQRLGGPDSELGRQVMQVAVAAAWKRVAIEPGGRTFRYEVYDYMRGRLRDRLAMTTGSLQDAHQRARQFMDDYKAGKITPDHIQRKLTIASAQRLVSARLYGQHLLGFEVKNANLLIPDKGWPKVEVEYEAKRWNGKKLFGHVASAGNVDSALTIMLAYQDGGSDAAIWATAYEIAMNVPIISKGNALKELFVNHRPQGAVMLGSAMVVPVLGQAFMFINIGKTSVILLGKFVLDPLKDDDADKMYQGFLDQRSGFKSVERSQRPSLLHFVPIRVIPQTIDGPDGKPIQSVVWKQYSRAEADKLFNVLDDDLYKTLADKGALGGGDAWDDALAKVHNDVANPTGHFEAKRASMFYHFQDKVQPLLAEGAYDANEPDALPIIAEYFMTYVDDWVNARGVFADFGENLLIARRFEDEFLRRKIAMRAAQDYARSYSIVRGNMIDEPTIERSIEGSVEQAKFADTAGEVNAMVAAIDDAMQLDPSLDLAHAIHGELDKRKEDAREPAPRFHARPSIVKQTDPYAYDKTDAIIEGIDFLISIVDGPAPGETTFANTDYKTEVRYEFEKISEHQLEVIAYITVVGAQDGKTIPPFAPKRYDNYSVNNAGELEIRLGKIERAQSLPENVDLRVSYRTEEDAKKPEKAPKLAAPGKATMDQYGTHYDDWDAAKASPNGTEWAGQPVSNLTAQLWLCWEKAPLGRFYYYDMAVTGGAHGYEQTHAGVAHVRDHYPGEEDAPAWPNIFILPFDWPEGHVGTFKLKGSIYAFDKSYKEDEWQKQKPAATFTFDESFDIADERKATDVDLMVTWQEKVPVGEISRVPNLTDEQRAALVKRAYNDEVRVDMAEPYDPAKADIWHRRWLGEDDDRRVDPKLFIRWKDAPPKATFVCQMKLMHKGEEYAQSSSMDAVEALEDFPPAPSKVAPGNTAFAIKMPFPSSLAGTFTIEGKLLAYPEGMYSRTKWETTEPLATYPFEKQFEIRNRSRFAKGTVSVSSGSMTYVQILLGYVQCGKRLAKVTAGGVTMYTMLDKNYYSGGYFRDKPRQSHWINLKMPAGVPPMAQATVTFMDYDEEVTMNVELEPEGNGAWALSERLAKIDQNVANDLAKAEKYKAAEPTKSNLDQLRRIYASLSGTYRSYDQAKTKTYAQLANDYDEKYYALELEAAQDEKERQSTLRAAASGATRMYNIALEWGNAGEMIGAFEAAVAKVQGSGLETGQAHAILTGLYSGHAQALVTWNGDLAAACQAWAKSEELSKTATKRFTFTKRGDDPPKCPHQPDEAFR